MYKKLKLLFDLKLFRQALLAIKMIYMGRVTKYPPEVIALEHNFSRYLNVKYALSFCNGTSAFDSAVFALGLSDGDEVLLSGMTFQSIVFTLLHNRLNLHYLDIREDLSPILNDELITEKTKAILISHLFGYPQDMDYILEFANKHGLRVIEDCSHAHGAEYANRKVGTFGNVAFFSFQGYKAVNGGEAGIAVTNDVEIYNKMMLYSHMGRDLSFIKIAPEFTRNGYGRKGRMHPLSAALSLVDMQYLDRKNKVLLSKVSMLKEYIKSRHDLKLVPTNNKSVLGGFNYGIPIWVNTIELANKYLNKSPSVLFPYPYDEYSRYDVFKTHADFISVLKNDELPLSIDKHASDMGLLSHAKNRLIFFDITALIEITALSDFESILDVIYEN
jgi:dTDP-4-amino-4,6-dideoxygalactose transaminase